MNNYFYYLLFVWSLFFSPIVYAIKPLNNIDELRAQQQQLRSLDLSKLLDVEIISVSKKSQKLSESAAAVFVITQEDIRRSGAENIAEVLRMVPGVQVARINAYAYAISVRGFNSSFANKLLVLIDGRSVYTPEFSGVYWDSVDMPLEDIERVEVIRGTGGTLWGANAVNGVINIITKKSEDTQGSLLSARAGTEQKYAVTLRHGGMLSDGTYFRVSAKLDKHDDFPAQTDELVVDSQWDRKELSFRLDNESEENNNWLLTGNYQSIQLGTDQWDVGVAQVDVKNINLLSRWERHFNDDSRLKLQTYYDYSTRKDLSLFSIDNRTFDFELQYELNPNETHNLLMGIGYRHVRADTPFSIFYDFQKLDGSLYNIFVQDDIHLVPDELTLTVGTKLEHHYYTGLALQPNIRLLWMPNPENTVWAAVSRAVRTPSRYEYDTKAERPAFPGEFNPYNPESMTVRWSGNSYLEAEKVIAYEMGIRHQLPHLFSIDIAGFVNQYKDLALLETKYLIEPVKLFQQTNGMKATSYGLELALNWMINDKWSLSGAYTWEKITTEVAVNKTFESDFDISIETRTPRHQFSLRSHFDLTEQTELDFGLYHVSQLPTLNDIPDFYVPSYTSFNARFAWCPTKNMELSLAGQNLFDKQHMEFAGELLTLYFREEVERNIYGQISWNF